VMHTKACTIQANSAFGYEPKVDFWRGLELTHTWAMNSPLF